MRAISFFSRELGISVVSCIALLALRIRVSMSATGSVSICSSPARLRHARDDALVGEVAQADPAEAELLVHGARPTAAVAAAVLARRELLRARGLDHERLLGHALLVPPVLGERQAQPAQERARLVVGLRRGRDGHVEAADPVDGVVVDLREDDLLADPERVVAATVERARVEPAEVADPRQRDRHEPVEELVHPRATQRHLRADRHPLADLEARDRLPRPAELRTLAGDDRQLIHRVVERLRLELRLADAHVQRHLRDDRHLHDRRVAEVVLQLAAELLLVARLQARHVAVRAVRAHLRSPRSISWPQSARRQTRTFTGSPLISRNLWPMRVARWQTGQTTMTSETSIGAGFSSTPPGWICWPPIRPESRIGRGRWWRLTMLRFSTITRPSRGRAWITRPCLPRSLPLRTWTMSPFRTFIGPLVRVTRSS